MKERTLVHVIASEDYICLRTVSRIRKSPHRFYIFCHSLEELEYSPEVIVHDIRSFAVMRRNASTGNLEIEFTWLAGYGDTLSGHQNTIILPYDGLMECLRESKLQGKPVTWKTFSVDHCSKRPRLAFNSRKNLKAALGNGILRRKLIRALQTHFNWPDAERIEFFDDFVPYSFGFREIKGGEPGIAGGLILHGQENISVVLCGSFERMLQAKSEASGSIGFGQSARRDSQIADCTEEDLVKYANMRREIAGRISRIVTLDTLHADDFEAILQSPASPIKAIEKRHNVKLAVDAPTRRKLAEEAEKSKMGCRYIRSRLQNMLDEQMFDFPEAGEYELCCP